MHTAAAKINTFNYEINDGLLFQKQDQHVIATCTTSSCVI